MRAKLGVPEAATAHKPARIIYAMLKNQTEYQYPGEGYYEEKARLGFQLIEEAAS